MSRGQCLAVPAVRCEGRRHSGGTAPDSHRVPVPRDARAASLGDAGASRPVRLDRLTAKRAVGAATGDGSTSDGAHRSVAHWFLAAFITVVDVVSLVYPNFSTALAAPRTGVPPHRRGVGLFQHRHRHCRPGCPVLLDGHRPEM